MADPVYLTLEEAKAVLVAADTEEQWLAFLVALYHGLRATEVCKLTGANIQDGHIDVKRLKGSLRTRQPFINHPEPLLNEMVALRKLAREKGPRERLFPSLNHQGVKGEVGRFVLYRWFQKAAQKAGLPKWKQHPHCLKHTTCMMMIGQGIEYTRQYAGHKNISSTGAYLRVSDAMASEKAAVVFGGK